MRRRLALAAALAVAANAATADAPYTPNDDGVVLERIAVPRLPGTASLRELRDTWQAMPAHLPAALAYARAALELNRREEDPRCLGYAEAALAPWSARAQGQPEAVLLRASLRLARADYDRALSEPGLPPGERVLARLAVNLGVEAAQLAVVPAVIPASFVCRRSPWYRRLVLIPGALFVTVVGALWLLQRAFAIDLDIPAP
jgi:hypothetical protein